MDLLNSWGKARQCDVTIYQALSDRVIAIPSVFTKALKVGMIQYHMMLEHHFLVDATAG